MLGNADEVEMLLVAGANPLIGDTYYRHKPLGIAKYMGHHACTQLLQVGGMAYHSL